MAANNHTTTMCHPTNKKHAVPLTFQQTIHTTEFCLFSLTTLATKKLGQFYEHIITPPLNYHYFFHYARNI